MIYEEFRDKVRQALEAATEPLTWTEVKTAANLPQKWPNNQWVHRLETDIGLLREPDTHGAMRWRIPVRKPKKVTKKTTSVRKKL